MSNEPMQHWYNPPGWCGPSGHYWQCPDCGVRTVGPKHGDQAAHMGWCQRSCYMRGEHTMTRDVRTR